MKKYCLMLAILLKVVVFSQQIQAIESYESATPIDTWTIDGQQNLIVASKNNLQKKAIKGERRFNQTFKSMGDIESISPVNALKIILFSEVQQTIVQLDNTLTQQGDELDLNELGFSNVAQICASNRPNLIWVFDQFRSSLNLVDFQKSTILQTVQNVEQGNHIVQLKEYQEHLFVLFSDGKMKQYDFLLNLSGSYDLNNCQQFDCWNDQLVCFSNKQAGLRFIPIDTRSAQINSEITLEMPFSSFKIQGNILGIQNGQKISLFSIKM